MKYTLTPEQRAEKFAAKYGWEISYGALLAAILDDRADCQPNRELVMPTKEEVSNKYDELQGRNTSSRLDRLDLVCYFLKKCLPETDKREVVRMTGPELYEFYWNSPQCLNRGEQESFLNLQEEILRCNGLVESKPELCPTCGASKKKEV